MKKAIFYSILIIVCGIASGYLLKGMKVNLQTMAGLLFVFIAGTLNPKLTESIESIDKEPPKYFEEPKG